MSVLMTSTKYGVNGLKEGGYMAESIRIVYEEGSGEYVEKKSRFIATLRPVSNLDEASEFIEEIAMRLLSVTIMKLPDALTTGNLRELPDVPCWKFLLARGYIMLQLWSQGISEGFFWEREGWSGLIRQQ